CCPRRPIIASKAKGSTRASPRFLSRPLWRMGSPAADKGRNRNAMKTCVSLAPYALRAGNPSGEKYDWIASGKPSQ
ncbi:MAG: hypothetical protein LBL79_14715, partial [Prevotella sp.]|nr:hypothetical protein [Prevotella sp.]